MGGITTIINKVKYIGIASLTIAILSVLILNIISSYSSSNTNSNAEPATQANGPLVSGPATISLSITPLTTPTSSPCDTSNSNICMKIPDDGGIATGGHTVEVSSNSYAGYNVLLSASESNNDETSLVNTTNGSGGGSNSYSIPTTTGNPSAPSKLDNNTWGYVLTNPTGQETNAIWAGLQPSTHKTAIATTNSLSNQTDNYSVYYGVKVDNPSELLAGDYQTQVVYTATVKLPSKPTITSITPSTYELGSGADSTVTIAGTNLASTYKVYIESNTDSTKQYDITNTITNLTDTELTVTIPTDQTNPDLEPGDYTIHVVTQGGEGSVRFSYTKPTLPAGVRQVTADYGSDGHVAVDFDEHMIPVKYAGNTTTPRWEVVTDAELEDNPANWFSYTANKKQWANAVTVTESSLQKYLNAEKGSNQHYEVDNDDVLGYWVYIPRYAYEVMRRDATDRVVGPQEFDIRFETKGDVKKIPQRCTVNSNIKTAAQMWRNGTPTAEATSTNSNILAVDYRTGCGISRTYGAATGTTWATHPAFTFGSTELNGFWVGKFETTGKINSPTVKPNQQSNVAQLIGEFYTAAKSVGYPDPNNVGGNTVSGTVQNSHNMAYLNSSLVRNREFGSVFMLIYSKHGRFQNGEIPNSLFNAAAKYGNNNRVQYDADGDEARYGTTGCGPISEEPGNTINYWFYEDGTYLSSSKIESETACSADTRRSYNGSLGVLASSTGNEYGVYDIVAGAGESAAGNLNQRAGVTTSSSEFSVPATYPYVDMYRNSVSDFAGKQGWSVGQTSNFYNVDSCTWELCGGTFTHEAGYCQSLDRVFQGWGNLLSFVDEDNPWVLRDSIAPTGFHGVGALDNSNGSVPSPSSTTITYRISMIARY